MYNEVLHLSLSLCLPPPPLFVHVSIPVPFSLNLSLPHLLFSVVERLSLSDLGYNLLCQLLLSRISCLLCQLLLFVAVVENGRHVLSRGAACWVMVLPEQLEHLSVGCLLRIKVDLHRLCVITTEGELVAKTVCQCIDIDSCPASLTY